MRALLFLLVLFQTGSGRSRAEVPLRDRINRENRKLGEVRNRYKTIQKKIRALTGRRDELETRLHEARMEQKELVQQIADLQRDAIQARRDVERARAALLAAQRAHSEYRKSYSDRLVYIYKRSQISPIGPLLESRSIGDMVQQASYLQFLEEDAGRLRQLQDGRDQVARQTEALEQAQNHSENLRGTLSVRKKTLEGNILEQSRLLDQIRRERSHEVRRAGRLKEAQDILVRKIKNLQSAARIAGRERPHQNRRRSVRKGQMRWPIDGTRTILKPFGRMTNEAGTPEFNSGIDILVTRPTSVRASAAGRVMFQGIFSPVYGKVVMIDHGGSPGNVITLYGNLETILVGVDQRLEEGDIIGMVGGEANGGRSSHLHMEIRKGPNAQNPLHWLSPR
jgi:septal ring factor EnvC (AmiA/AmiB activator)